MELTDILAASKIRWDDLYIELDAGTSLIYSFPIQPRDFLSFARADLAQSDERGLINSVSNAKRAIDCQTDCFVYALSFDPNNLRSQLGNENMKRLFSNLDIDLPLEFKFLSYLGIVTPRVVKQARRMRNLLEHEYKKPTKNAASNAIEIAELYVGACEGLMNLFYEHVILGSDLVDYQSPLTRFPNRITRWLSIWMSQLAPASSTNPPTINVSYGDVNINSTHGQEVKIPSTHNSFLPLLKLLFSVRTLRPDDVNELISDILQINGINLKKKKVRVRSIDYA